MYSVMEWNLSLMESNRSNRNVMCHGIDWRYLEVVGSNVGLHPDTALSGRCAGKVKASVYVKIAAPETATATSKNVKFEVQISNLHGFGLQKVI